MEILSGYFQRRTRVNIIGTLSSIDTTTFCWMRGVESTLGMSYKVDAVLLIVFCTLLSWISLNRVTQFSSTLRKILASFLHLFLS